MNTNLGPSPGAKRYPQHTLTIRESDMLWSAVLDGHLLARSNKALLVDESGYAPVVYFPAGDVRSESLQQSDARTTCPFKGEAGYYAAVIDGELKDIAWYYPTVYQDVEAIAGHIAFYANLVELISEEKDDN